MPSALTKKRQEKLNDLIAQWCDTEGYEHNSEEAAYVGILLNQAFNLGAEQKHD